MATDLFKHIRDPLYGALEFEPALLSLISKPLVQRLRHVRLSNIDSISLPGICGVTRYEHALGTCYLSTKVGFRHRLSSRDRLLLSAAALLHDSAITPFAHLMEEAFQYLSVEFHHEQKWQRLFAGESEPDIGGLAFQLFLGHDSGLRPWMEQQFRSEADTMLESLLASVQGKPPFGPCIAGELDLDNLDNVTRAAFHIGLPIDPQLPVTIAAAMTGLGDDGPLFAPEALPSIEEWLTLREDLYTHLMLAPADFAGKVMLVYAMVTAQQTGQLTSSDWQLTDFQLMTQLLGCRDPVASTVKRWLLGDLWDLSNLTWHAGPPPDLPSMKAFSSHLTTVLGRDVFAYRIKDKRHRSVAITLQGARNVSLGSKSKRWLLGVGSLKKAPFTVQDNRRILKAAVDIFGVAAAVTEAGATHSARSLF